MSDLIRSKDAMASKTEMSRPSSALLTAALAGLVCVGSACRKDKDDDDTVASTGPQVTSTTVAEDMTFAKFSEDCETRGGLVEMHAACSGAATCKGVSFNKFSKKMVEHTCKGGNTCGGMSCIDLPKDTGLSGEEVYKAACQSCHGDEEMSFAETFKLYLPADTADKAAAVAAFTQKPTAQHVSVVAFGTHGQVTSENNKGTEYSNMPAFYQKYSRAEIEKVVDHVRTLTPVAEDYDNAGIE